MDRRREVISLLIVGNFVVMAAALFVLVPFDVFAPVLPVFLVLVVVLGLYLS